MKSKFAQWLSRMDECDKHLAPQKRRLKWLTIIGLLALLFLVSFFFFPTGKVNYQSLESKKTDGTNPADSLHREPNGRFDLPTDSFEQLLKESIDENLAEE